MRNNIRYVRGSIWWADFGPINNNSHLQYGHRPCVVVSNNKANRSSPVVHICPITTQRDNLPIHIPCNLDGRPSWVMCEHARPVDVSELTDFKGILEESVMAKVDEGLRIQFNLVPDKDEEIIHQLELLQKTLEQLEEIKTKHNKQQIEKDIHIKESINLINQSVNKYAGMSAIEKFNARAEQAKKKEEPKKKRTKWTDELKKQLIEDSSKMTYEQLISKYGFKDKKTVQTYVNKFKKDFQK